MSRCAVLASADSAQTPAAKPQSTTTTSSTSAICRRRGDGERSHPTTQAWVVDERPGARSPARQRQRPGHDPGRREHHRQRHGGFGARRRTAAAAAVSEALRHREEDAGRTRSVARSSRRRLNRFQRQPARPTAPAAADGADDGPRVRRAAQRRPGASKACARSTSTAIGRSSC